jgi:hypothetical protein
MTNSFSPSSIFWVNSLTENRSPRVLIKVGEHYYFHVSDYFIPDSGVVMSITCNCPERLLVKDYTTTTIFTLRQTALVCPRDSEETLIIVKNLKILF